jgi:hypothetical protein
MQENIKNRVEAFMKEYGELVKKHGIDIANYPVYTPDGQGGFKTVLQASPVDVSKQENAPASEEPAKTE